MNGLNERPVDLRKIMRDFERSWITWALRQYRGNRALAARALGIGRTTLVEKVRRHGIDRLEVIPEPDHDRGHV